MLYKPLICGVGLVPVVRSILTTDFFHLSICVEGVREKHEDRSATASALPPATPSAGAALTPVNKLWVTLTPHVLKVIIIVLLVAIVIGLVAVLTLVGISE